MTKPAPSSPTTNPMITGAAIREKLGVVDRTLSRWFEAGLKCKRDAHGKSPRVRMWDLIKWLYEGEESEDAIEAADSPNLERYRKAKADEQERKNAIAMGGLLQSEEVANQARTAAAALRLRLEVCARAHPEIEGDLHAAIEAFVSDMFAAFPEPKEIEDEPEAAPEAEAKK